MPEERDWATFIRITGGSPPWPNLVRAAAFLPHQGDALDFGCGAGRDTAHLLRQGFHVTAVDAAPLAATAMRRMPRQRRLTFVQSRFEDFEPDPTGYDLVNSQYALPFIPADRFDATVRRILAAVRPGGVLACNFFGPNDSWAATATDIRFTSRAEVEDLLDGWDVEELAEEDADGTTADGTPKHWHIFHVIAKKPG